MRSCKYLRNILIIILFALSLFAQEASILKIVNPPNEDINDEDIVSFVVEADNNFVDWIIISNKSNDSNESNETFDIKVNPTHTHYCKSIHLHLGENNISVSGYKNDILVKQEIRMIFLKSKVYKEYRYPPEKYSRNYFHNESGEKLCASCHDMSVNEVKDVAFVDVTKSNCYQCHSLVTAKQHGHAPAVNWLCTSCHSGKVGKFNKAEHNKTKYTVPDPIGPLCYSCHKKNRDKWDKRRFKHEPAESGRCNRCHNSHSSPNPFFTRKSAWELCTGCHKDKIAGMHIVKTFGRAMHPTHDVKDPSRPGKNLSCVSCHNPHASESSSLLQSRSAFSLCTRCHKK